MEGGRSDLNVGRLGSSQFFLFFACVLPVHSQKIDSLLLDDDCSLLVSRDN